MTSWIGSHVRKIMGKGEGRTSMRRDLWVLLSALAETVAHWRLEETFSANEEALSDENAELYAENVELRNAAQTYILGIKAANTELIRALARIQASIEIGREAPVGTQAGTDEWVIEQTEAELGELYAAGWEFNADLTERDDWAGRRPIALQPWWEDSADEIFGGPNVSESDTDE